MTTEVKLHTPGRLVTGEEQGLFIEVLDDSKNTGGFLILSHYEPDRSASVFDNWVETKSDLEKFFEGYGSEIEWFPEGLGSTYSLYDAARAHPRRGIVWMEEMFGPVLEGPVLDRLFEEAEEDQIDWLVRYLLLEKLKSESLYLVEDETSFDLKIESALAGWTVDATQLGIEGAKEVSGHIWEKRLLLIQGPLSDPDDELLLELLAGLEVEVMASGRAVRPFRSAGGVPT